MAKTNWRIPLYIELQYVEKYTNDIQFMLGTVESAFDQFLTTHYAFFIAGIGYLNYGLSIETSMYSTYFTDFSGRGKESD